MPEFDDPRIRKIVVLSYGVIYRVDHANCQVDIALFCHGARGTPEVGEA